MYTAIASNLRAPSYLVSVKPATLVPLLPVLTQKGKSFPFSIRDTQERLFPNLQNFSARTDFRNHLVFSILFLVRNSSELFMNLQWQRKVLYHDQLSQYLCQSYKHASWTISQMAGQHVYCLLTMPVSLPMVWTPFFLELETVLLSALVAISNSLCFLLQSPDYSLFALLPL